MSNRDYLPTRESVLLGWVVAFLAALTPIIDRVGFPQAVLTALNTLYTTFKTKWDIANASSTRTKATIKAKNIAKKELIRALRLNIKYYLTYNPAVTDDDRENLGLPIHKTTPTPAPVPDTYPKATIKLPAPGVLEIHFVDSATGLKAKPAGVHGAEIRWAILPTPPTRWDDLTHSEFDTSSPFQLEFENDQRGKTVYYALRWENNSGKKGHWGEIESAIIP
ncbi:MAG: hypothetical protein LBS12_01480 [Prevotellaceae bacterium]|nr:hypothetical protein [Prevotellaceae bacterium]